MLKDQKERREWSLLQDSMITQLFSLSVSHSDSTRVDIFPPNYHRRERRKPNYLLHPPLSFFMTLIFKYGPWIKTEKLFYYYLWARPILSRQERKGKKERKKRFSHLSHLLFQFQGTGTRATKQNFFFLTFSYVLSVTWKCKALSTGCLSDSSFYSCWSTKRACQRKCYKQPCPHWKRQYAVSQTYTSLFRSLSTQWLMV